jgi:hypothetical protein
MPELIILTSRHCPFKVEEEGADRQAEEKAFYF